MSENTKKLLLQVDGNHAQTDRLAVPSAKRLKANRENAKKSTGPRTSRGKAYSRRNAIKHGLFARTEMNFFLQNEDWSEYEALLAHLREDYKPVGRAEELEVERIAQSWWRLKRADRYENAAKCVAARDVVRGELAEQYEYCDKRDEEEKNIIRQLQKLADEIEAADQVPTNWRERLVAITSESGMMWPLLETEVNQYVTDHPDLAWLAKEASAGASF